MQRRRRRLTVTAFVTLAAVFAAAVLLLLAFRVPRQFFRGEGELVLSRVLLVDGGEETDVTGRVDGALLMSSLRLMKTDFFSRKVQSLDSDQIRYALDGTCGGRPFHIVLGDGEQNYLYESADQGMYAIWDSGAWMALLDALTGEKA